MSNKEKSTSSKNQRQTLSNPTINNTPQNFNNPYDPGSFQFSYYPPMQFPPMMPQPNFPAAALPIGFGLNNPHQSSSSSSFPNLDQTNTVNNRFPMYVNNNNNNSNNNTNHSTTNTNNEQESQQGDNDFDDDDKPGKKRRTNYRRPENAAKLNAAVNALIMQKQDPNAPKDIRSVSKIFNIPYNTLRDNYLRVTTGDVRTTKRPKKGENDGTELFEASLDQDQSGFPPFDELSYDDEDAEEVKPKAKVRKTNPAKDK